MSLLLSLLLVCQLLGALAQCPAPFSLEAGRCVLVNPAQNFSWCSANQRCASIGGELVNSYSSLQLLGSMPSVNCGCNLWLGVSDIESERNMSKSGWQRINDNGVLSFEDSLWSGSDPNNGGGIQDCLVTFPQSSGRYGLFGDFQCSTRRGFACEFAAAAQPESVSSSAWQQTPFKRTSFNPSTEYCYTDLLQVKNGVHCVAAAMRAGNSRHALFNSKLRTCRLLQFTDAQVEQEIETSPDWVKFSVF